GARRRGSRGVREVEGRDRPPLHRGAAADRARFADPGAEAVGDDPRRASRDPVGVTLARNVSLRVSPRASGDVWKRGRFPRAPGGTALALPAGMDDVVARIWQELRTSLERIAAEIDGVLRAHLGGPAVRFEECEDAGALAAATIRVGRACIRLRLDRS